MEPQHITDTEEKGEDIEAEELYTIEVSGGKLEVLGSLCFDHMIN